ncbi:glutamine amidotransferase [Chitinolyticbacter albus]|uniref:glutamine amidotransferase n=1 Tax=Chitinolyticbacter albus TaxID=2961951 RepID=UPI00210D682B|nr:glutamine amidotransferase [Chitinolyticbacter albus]
MKTAAVIRHIQFEDLGLFGAPLAAAGYDIRCFDAGVDDLAAAYAADLTVLCGGPIGAYQDADYPWLVDEKRGLAARLQAMRPTLGLCLGAQLIAAALGARVYPGHAREIGWGAITLSPAGQASPLAVLQDKPVLHWHGDTFDLPVNATLLASSALYPNQAFALGPAVLGLQFHPEVDPARIEQWLVGHASELAAASIPVNWLRDEAGLLGGAAPAIAEELLQNWLAQLPG